MSDRLKVMLALVASVLVHVLLVAVLALGTWLLPAHPIETPIPEMKTVEVTLQSVPTPTPEPATIPASEPPPLPEQKLTRSVLDTEGLAESDKAPEKPLFESDKNSVAASDRPATGSAPLPSQEGKTRPFDQFTTQSSSLGPGQQPGMELAAAPEPKPPAPQQTPPPDPLRKPEPEPTPAPDDFAADMTAEEAAATPAEQPIFTPTPIPKSPSANGFALGKPTPVPVPPKKPTPKPSPAAEVAMLATKPEPRPEKPRQDPGYQAQKEQTKIEGSISNRGRPGVDAIGTPLGRYRKAIADAIGSRWYYHINQRMDLITVGDVHIKFVINEQGRVQGVKILSNTANATFGEFCMRSVTEARIPPLPPELAATLDDGQLEIEYHFTIYPQ